MFHTIPIFHVLRLREIIETIFDPIMKRSERSSLDIISNLPNNVIESIIARLPIRDAIRTSILSTKWKDKWVTLPHLVFNDNTFKGSSVDPQAAVMTDEDEIIKVISQVLLQHNSLVRKFVLSISHLRSCPSIDHWLSFLSTNGIEDLTLQIQTALSYKMPYSFFSCQHLRRLRLYNCIVRPPSTFSGFKKLTTIVFERVLCPASSLENIIANSPLLKELLLSQMLDLHPLNINSPNLKCLWFGGKTESICSINAPRLVLLSLSITRLSGSSNHGERNRSSSLFNLFGCLPATIEKLGLNAYTSQFFDAGNLLKNLPNTFSHLWIIILRRFSFENLDSVACALCLITNAPNLKEIQMYIEACESPSADVEQVLTLMKANLGSSLNLKKLLSFTITSIGGTKPECEFIKFILATSPVLRKVTIIADRAHPSYNGFTTMKELMSFSRASSAAQIIYSEKE